MIGTIIFLKINATTTKILFELIQDFLVLLDEFYVKLGFYSDSASFCTRYFGITNVDREASFTIYQSYNVIWVKILYLSESFIWPFKKMARVTMTQLTSDAA